MSELQTCVWSVYEAGWHTDVSREPKDSEAYATVLGSRTSKPPRFHPVGGNRTAEAWWHTCCQGKRVPSSHQLGCEGRLIVKLTYNAKPAPQLARGAEFVRALRALSPIHCRVAGIQTVFRGECKRAPQSRKMTAQLIAVFVSDGEDRDMAGTTRASMCIGTLTRKMERSYRASAGMRARSLC